MTLEKHGLEKENVSYLQISTPNFRIEPKSTKKKIVKFQRTQISEKSPSRECQIKELTEEEEIYNDLAARTSAPEPLKTIRDAANVKHPLLRLLFPMTVPSVEHVPMAVPDVERVPSERFSSSFRSSNGTMSPLVEFQFCATWQWIFSPS